MSDRVETFRRFHDLTLEVTQGCRHNCTGCQVDRENNRLPTDEEYDRLEAMVVDLKNNQVIPADFIIGPTDIMTSTNREECLENPRLKQLLSHYRKLVLNCAFLWKNKEDYLWLAKTIDWLIPGGLVKLTVPFEVSQLQNQKYIAKIRERISWVDEALTSAKISKVYCAVNFDACIVFDRENGTSLTEDLIDKTYHVKLFHDTNVDFILPHGRVGFEDLMNRQNFINSTHRLNRLLLDVMDRYQGKGTGPTANELQSHEGLGWDTVFRNGDLYLRAFLVEPFASFEEEFRVKGSWDFAGFYNHRQEQLIDQLNYAQKTDDCMTCQHLGLCAERGVHSIMKIASIDECISAIGQTDNFAWT